MATLTYTQLKELITSVITAANLSSATFAESANNVAGLLDKIGKIYSIDTNFKADKLARFDGEYLAFGRTIEEWQADLILPQDYDASGDNAMNPDPSTFRPVFYSYTVGRKKIKQTIKNNDLERAVHNVGELASLTAMLLSRIDDSAIQYKYGLKREMLAKLAKLAIDEQNGTAVYGATTAYNVGQIVKESSTSEVRGIVFKKKTTASLTWANAVAQGYIVPLDLVKTMPIPTTDATGEDFIEQVKKDVEIAEDYSQGHSLNGNALGASTGLVLILKQGILPVLDVRTLAGAFHEDKLAIPANVVTIPDFGSDSNGVFAILMDARGMALHTSYDAVRENFNGDGDFINYFRHMEHTATISRNTFVKVYKAN